MEWKKLDNFFTARQPLMGQGFLIVEASRSHSDTPHSVGHLWTSDQLVAEADTYTTHNKHKRGTSTNFIALDGT